MRTRKTQNIKINMTCGSDFRLKKLYLFLHIFLTFSRENSRLGTSPPMMKSVWSHLNSARPKFFTLCKINELTCAYMFSQAHFQKNTHKKVFSLVEISNIYCVFLLRNANIFSFAC